MPEGKVARVRAPHLGAPKLVREGVEEGLKVAHTEVDAEGDVGGEKRPYVPEFAPK